MEVPERRGAQQRRLLRNVALSLFGALALSMGVASSAQAASILTKDRAYRAARACLLNHGARFVGRRGDGGGFATLRRGSTFWTYKTFLGKVSSVTIYFAGQPAPAAAMKRIAKVCVTKGI